MTTKWNNSWDVRERGMITREAGARALSDVEGGVAERALGTAENAVEALCHLVEILHDKGVLTDSEVQSILDLHGYEVDES